MVDAVAVWNRACDYDFTPSRGGDKILKAAIQLDGLTGNGGLGHALDVLGRAEVEESITALQRLGLAEAAGIVRAALAVDDEGAREAMTDAYYEAAERLYASFERYYRQRPSEFEPASPEIYK